MYLNTFTIKDQKIKIDTGIYSIQNRFSKKIYIGSSMDIKKRLGQHCISLLHNKHHNKDLQADFNLYDCDLNLFTFSIVKKLSNNVPFFYLHSIEQMYIDKYRKRNKLYNIATPSKKSGMSVFAMKCILLKQRITNMFEK
jgi:group I intron endonuclease